MGNIPPFDYEFKQIDIDEFFEKDSSQTVNFEILVAALISSMLLTTTEVSPILHPISKLVAISLLVLTLARRMSLDNRRAYQERLIAGTNWPIFAGTFFGILYVLLSLAEQTATIVPLSPYIYLSVFLMVFPIGTVVVYEIMYRDLTLWFVLLYYNKYVEHRGDPFGDALIKLAPSAVKSPLYDLSHTLDLFQRLSDTPTEQQSFIIRVASGIGAILGVVLVLLMLAVGTPVLLYFVTDSVLISVLLSVSLGLGSILLIALLTFTYARYGNSSFETPIGAKRQFSLVLLLYLTIIIDKQSPAILRMIGL
ncbi:hypothetical protein [Salinirussus salinus]|uniref:hypothetical protein n=1 Tax=Salinirussus salinus TaxID=1198300 RepID=UPI00135B0692|nr:hypothetical protein [Salinirussus salinus]